MTYLVYPVDICEVCTERSQLTILVQLVTASHILPAGIRIHSGEAARRGGFALPAAFWLGGHRTD